MRLIRRIEQIEAALGPPHARGSFAPRRPARRVSEPEANAAYLRVVNAIQAATVALIDKEDPPPVDEAAFERDVDALHQWSEQRGLPHNAEISRARQQVLTALSDDELEGLSLIVEARERSRSEHETLR